MNAIKIDEIFNSRRHKMRPLRTKSLDSKHLQQAKRKQKFLMY